MEIIPPEQWSQKQWRVKKLPHEQVAVSWHCSGVANGDPKYDDFYWARQTERFHMKLPRVWGAPAYGYQIGWQGNCFEMRGKRIRNGAEGKRARIKKKLEHGGAYNQDIFGLYAKNAPNLHTISVEFVEVGNCKRIGGYLNPTFEAIRTAHELAKRLFAAIPSLRYSVGHNWHRAKDCPGRYINDLINAGWLGPVPFQPFVETHGANAWLEEHGVCTVWQKPPAPAARPFVPLLPEMPESGWENWSEEAQRYARDRGITLDHWEGTWNFIQQKVGRT